MKITKIETLCLSRMHEPERQWLTSQYRTVKADCAIVVVHTDGGLQGIGEASAYGWPLVIRDWVSWLAPEMAGRDPGDPAIVPHPNGLSRGHAGIKYVRQDHRTSSRTVATARAGVSHIARTLANLYLEISGFTRYALDICQ